MKDQLIKEFEDFCSVLAITNDSPSEQNIKDFAEKYADHKIKQITEIQIYTGGKWVTVYNEKTLGQ